MKPGRADIQRWFDNLFEGKVIYREKFIAVVRLENVEIISSTYLCATAIPLLDITAPESFGAATQKTQLALILFPDSKSGVRETVPWVQIPLLRAFRHHRRDEFRRGVLRHAPKMTRQELSHLVKSSISQSLRTELVELRPRILKTLEGVLR
jgi:hypothetical protein